jgi:UDP-glucuronate 4-epimerase
VRYSLENPELYVQYNIQGTVTILETMKNHGVMNIVLASSSSVYGDSDQEIFTEESQDDNRLKSPYAISKRTIELYGNMYHALYSINVTCLRLFTVYGQYGRMDMAPFLFMDAICTQKPITIMGDGFAKRDFTFIQDVVNGFVLAIDKPLGFSAINIGSGTTIFIKDFIKKIENIAGKEAIIIYDKPHKADVLSTCADISKAQMLLDYQPLYSYDQGLRLLYEWYCTVYQDIKDLHA